MRFPLHGLPRTRGITGGGKKHNGSKPASSSCRFTICPPTSACPARPILICTGSAQSSRKPSRFRRDIWSNRSSTGADAACQQAARPTRSPVRARRIHSTGRSRGISNCFGCVSMMRSTCLPQATQSTSARRRKISSTERQIGLAVLGIFGILARKADGGRRPKTLREIPGLTAWRRSRARSSGKPRLRGLPMRHFRTLLVFCLGLTLSMGPGCRWSDKHLTSYRNLTLDLGKIPPITTSPRVPPSRAKMKLVQVPAGTFLMGFPDSEKHRSDEPACCQFCEGDEDNPSSRVSITRPFYIGVTEVTQEQYEALMGKNPSRSKDPRNPVVWVSWNDAVAFCQALSRKTGKVIRLPTEAEWEYAQSLHQLHRSVLEWCSYWGTESYTTAETGGPKAPYHQGCDSLCVVSDRAGGGVLRGGPRLPFAAARRYFRIPGGRNRYAGVGFRVVVEVGPDD